VLLRAPREALERLTLYWPAEIESLGDRDALVRVTFPGREVALFQLLAWSDAATLIEPAELRRDVAARARQALKRYAKPSR
jgi:predicted DNA-binding transcriptional regulator YafY